MKNIIQETETLVLWIPVAFAFGCLFYFLLPFEPSVYLGLVGFISSLGMIMLIRRFCTAYLAVYQVTCCICLISAGFSLSWWQTHRQAPFYHVPFRATIIQGNVKAVEYLTSGKKRITLQNTRFLVTPESDQHEWPRFVLFTLSKNDVQSVQIGDEIQARVMLHRPSSPQFVGGYDLQFRSWFKNIGAYGYALEPIKIISSQPTYSVRHLREKIAARIRQVDPNASGVIAQILLTGIGGELSANDRHAFAASGLAHLLAIAGLHLGIVMAIVACTVRWLLLRSQILTLYWPIKTIAVVTGWVAGCCYLILTGLHLPAMRSLFMASIVVLALLCNRPIFSKYNLMLAALFLLFISPASVLDVSFQMSMAAVMALVSGFQFIHQWVKKSEAQESYLHRFVKIYFLESMWVSVLAGTAVVPIVMFYFHELNLYFVFANLIAVPLTALWIMPLGMMALCTMPFGLDYIFLKLMTFGIQGVIWLAEWVSHFPYASIAVPIFPSWGYGCYFLGLCVFCLCVTSIRWVGIVMIIIGLSSIFFVTLPDIVTTSNGRMIGIREKQILYTICQTNCDLLTLEEWRKALKITQVKIITPDENGLQCHENYCLFDRHKIFVVLNKLYNKQEAFKDCQSSILEFSFLWNGYGCQKKMVINKKANWIQGAHSIWLHPLTIVTDLEKRGKRPWVMEPIQRGVPNMPMAQQE